MYENTSGAILKFMSDDANHLNVLNACVRDIFDWKQIEATPCPYNEPED